MGQRNRLTNNSDETDVASLLSGDNIFAVPYFQRPYKWKPERLKQLQADLLAVVDEEDFHFLGAVIVHGRRTNPSEPDVYDVIDGQQRITTLFLHIAAAIKILCESSEQSEAAGLFLKYLVIGRETAGLSNLKLHSCKEDRRQLNKVFGDILGDATLLAKLGGFKLRPLPESGNDTGTLWTNYRAAVRFFKEEQAQGGLDRVRAIYRALLERVSVVQIDVWDPTNGPKIFDSLNSRQEPMTIGDLVRNEIFSKVAGQNPAEIERVDAEAWQPFYRRFEQGGKNLFDSYFFPYGLTKKSTLRKSEVYSSLKKEWEAIDDPAEIISQLAAYQDAFLDLLCGSNLSKHVPHVADGVRRLHDLDFPSAALPFLMHLLKATKEGEVTPADSASVLAVIESFFVRRAVCGIEPTGLHAVFKRLWTDCNGEITADRVRKEITKHKTVAWPTDREFCKAIASRALYGASITNFLICEFDKSIKGDNPSGSLWIEHVLPRDPEESWFQVFSKEQHSALKDVLANLLPLSSEMNRSLGNRSYSEKQPRYKAESMYKSTRAFAETYSTWTPVELEKRSIALSEWAAKRWAA